MTYGDALAAVLGFRRLIGTEPLTLVVALPGSIHASIAWLGALGGGHRLVLCPPEASVEERARLAATYRPRYALVEHPEDRLGFGVDQNHTITAERLRDLLPSEQSVSESGGEMESGWLDMGGEVCLGTSGTTGEPKGVTLRADQIAWTADQVRLSHGLTEADRGLSVLPFFHINAPVVSLSATLLAGASLVVAPRFSRSRFWDWMERGEITWASIVPTIVSHLLQTDKPDWLPGRLRFVRTASAPLPALWLRQFESRFAIPVIESYGLS